MSLSVSVTTPFGLKKKKKDITKHMYMKHKQRNSKHEVSCFLMCLCITEGGFHLQIKNNGARTSERFVTAGDALHPDGEGAISCSTGILKLKKKHPHYSTNEDHCLKGVNNSMIMELSLVVWAGRAHPRGREEQRKKMMNEG